MTSLSFLPAPKNALSATPKVAASTGKNDSNNNSLLALQHEEQQLASRAKKPPIYGQRKGFLPRTVEDYDDGGAYPEIHIPQYPLDMGREKSGKKANTVALQVDADGNIQYDAIVRQGHGKDKIIHAQYKDLVPMNIIDNHTDWTKPENEDVQETTDKTRAALEKMVNGKIKASKPKSLAILDSRTEGPTFVKYTPTAQNGKQGTSRIIRIVEMPIDPMEPPKYGFKKLPTGPPSPPAPVMHSPPRKVTKEQQAEWNIPPCISNWKNAKGFTIPLDKRLAADGRGLQELHINDNFAKFAEALLISERHAREETRQRAIMQQKLAQKEKSSKEESLRQRAQRAREERAGIVPTSTVATNNNKQPNRRSTSRSRSGSRTTHSRHHRSRSPSPRADRTQGHDKEADAARAERDAIRKDKARQLQREHRKAHMGEDAKAKHTKTMAERDISEKIALGVAQPTAGRDSMFDQRLFNQSEGLSSGFGSEDAYNLYDKPLFTGGNSGLNSIYRPKAAADDEMYGGDASEAYSKIVNTDRFTAGKGRGFSGTEGESQTRDGPVEFERDSAPSDPFGVRNFMNQAKKGRGVGDDTDREQYKKSRHE